MTAPRALRSAHSQSPDEEPSTSSTVHMPSIDPASDNSGNSAISRPHSTSSHMTPAEESDPPHSRSGGCWTCRVRRKKCDENRMDGSCATCLRLKIQCLGWGTQRPDWMRDKEQVALYKSQIKQQLIRSGRIRGQPKSSVSGSRPPAAPSLPSVPPVPSLPSTPGVPSFSDFIMPDDANYEGYADSSSSSGGRFSASPMMPLGTGRSWRNHRSLRPESIRNSDHSSYPRHSSRSIPYITTSRQVPSQQSLTTVPGMYQIGLNDSPTNYHVSHEVSPVKPSQERLVLFYFKSVLQSQFPLSDGSLINVLHEMVINNPEGPVALSICAITALYASKTACPPEYQIDASIYNSHEEFFNWSYWQLEETQQQNATPPTETDAIAAIQLLMYCILAGNTANWHFLLKTAGDWLENSAIHRQPNSRAVFHNSSDIAKFACRAVLWFDVFASCTFRSSPRFLRLHEALLRPNSLAWTGVIEPTQSADSVRVNALMGCPDNVMLALAETADLESWKNQQRLNGSLSIQSLCDRGRNIEVLLRQGRGSPSTSSPYPPGEVSQHASPVSISQVASASTSSPISFDASPMRYSPSNRVDSVDMLSLIGDVFRTGALLYLFTVVNDHFPHVPEIHECVQAMIITLKQMPITPMERGVVFPIFLAGALADDPLERTFFRNRLSVQDPNIGNVSSALKLMETVWERRAVQGGGVDWRILMNEMGVLLLLI